MYIKNINITDIRNNEAWKKVEYKYRRFMPKTLSPIAVSFELHNVNIGIANGLRRTLINECLGKCMTFELQNFSCTNPYMLNDFVLGRLQCIPINSNIDNSLTFNINITNNVKTRIAQINQRYDRVIRDYGKLNDYEIKQKEIDLKDAQNSQTMTVYSGDIVCNKKIDRLPFNETFQLCTLDDGNELKISSITLIEGYGYDHARHCLTSLCSCVPMDQSPLDLHTGKGVPAGLADPKIHKISFKTNGTMDPYTLIAYACKSLEERLIFIKGLKDEFKTINNEHILTIKGETHTIGNMLMKTIIENENVEGITYYANMHSRSMELKIKTDNDVKKIMDKTITYLMDIFKKIEKQLESGK